MRGREMEKDEEREKLCQNLILGCVRCGPLESSRKEQRDFRSMFSVCMHNGMSFPGEEPSPQRDFLLVHWKMRSIRGKLLFIHSQKVQSSTPYRKEREMGGHIN